MIPIQEPYLCLCFCARYWSCGKVFWMMHKHESEDFGSTVIFLLLEGSFRRSFASSTAPVFMHTHTHRKTLRVDDGRSYSDNVIQLSVLFCARLPADTCDVSDTLLQFDHQSLPRSGRVSIWITRRSANNYLMSLSVHVLNHAVCTMWQTFFEVRT